MLLEVNLYIYVLYNISSIAPQCNLEHKIVSYLVLKFRTLLSNIYGVKMLNHPPQLIVLCVNIITNDIAFYIQSTGSH